MHLKTYHRTSSLNAETDAWNAANVLNMQAHGNKHQYLYSQCVISRLPRIGIHPLWCTIVVKYLITPPVSSRSTCPVVLLVWLECERPGGNKKSTSRELHVKTTLWTYFKCATFATATPANTPHRLSGAEKIVINSKNCIYRCNNVISVRHLPEKRGSSSHLGSVRRCCCAACKLKSC